MTLKEFLFGAAFVALGISDALLSWSLLRLWKSHLELREKHNKALDHIIEISRIVTSDMLERAKFARAFWEEMVDESGQEKSRTLDN